MNAAYLSWPNNGIALKLCGTFPRFPIISDSINKAGVGIPVAEVELHWSNTIEIIYMSLLGLERSGAMFSKSPC